ncbi:hypothetical protein TCON_2068 [Astathelohania contejeani]|uniref:Ricin B lectin domain-containing protein n=1 Tax=Astathelohania contejeani TaxID=164912 RepID=A0ABQ7HX08_9MICR|nr:hypothetical protein TCON_2068 [Thelohania contejeani]
MIFLYFFVINSVKVKILHGHGDNIQALATNGSHLEITRHWKASSTDFILHLKNNESSMIITPKEEPSLALCSDGQEKLKLGKCRKEKGGVWRLLKSGEHHKLKNGYGCLMIAEGEGLVVGDCKEAQSFRIFMKRKKNITENPSIIHKTVVTSIIPQTVTKTITNTDALDSIKSQAYRSNKELIGKYKEAVSPVAPYFRALKNLETVLNKEVKNSDCGDSNSDFLEALKGGELPITLFEY